MSPRQSLSILLVEDDGETMEQFRTTLPRVVGDQPIEWEFCESFDAALTLLAHRRFDVVATDIYQDREGVPKGPPSDVDIRAREIVNDIRRKWFCPIVLFSDGTLPPSFALGEFLQFADKSGGDASLLAALGSIIATGVPAAARTLADELNGSGAEYLWKFLEENWGQLSEAGLTSPGALARVVRRRAATQLARMVEGPGMVEAEQAGAIDYYIYPRIPGRDLRLGDIARDSDGAFRVVLTPHCHLATQYGAAGPRIAAALTVGVRGVSEVFADAPSWATNDAKKRDQVRKRTQSPPLDLGSPEGRYWYLPALLDIPDVYCDFTDVTSVSVSALLDRARYHLVATLDAPYSEALQSCFIRFFSAVGLRALDPEQLSRLLA